MISRRDLLITLGASAVAPRTVLAQAKQPAGKVWRIGFLWERDQSDADYVRRVEAFKAGLRALDYAEGADYVIVHRSAFAGRTNLPAAAMELVALKVDLIVTSGTPSARASAKAAREIPILIVGVGDPVGAGFAATLERPGGNITGLASSGADLIERRVELVRELIPGLVRLAYLYDPGSVANVQGLSQFESICARLGLKSMRAPMRGAEDTLSVFGALQRDKAQALVVSASSTSRAWRDSIIARTVKYRLPAVYNSHFFVEGGGLVSYAANEPDLYRRVAGHAVRILKGEKPGDLPIEQPTKFELVVNLKTAKALGLTIPQPLLMRADRVIE